VGVWYTAINPPAIAGPIDRHILIILSAVETPVRQAVLPDLSSKISTTQAVSFHSFIINT
jgi:hypothetical protein